MKHSFFLLVGKMETLRLSPGRGAGEDFSFFAFFSPGSIFAFPPSSRRRHHPHRVISLSSCLRFVPSGDLFFTRFLVFGVATRFAPLCSVLYSRFPPKCLQLSPRDGSGAAFWGCAKCSGGRFGLMRFFSPFRDQVFHCGFFVVVFFLCVCVLFFFFPLLERIFACNASF